jgi:type III secretory pathway component EscS
VGGALAAGAAMSGVVAVTASVVSNARGVTEVSALAGAALLDLGRSIPFVAPVAYAIGTVVSLAETAADLKEDSRKFAKVILDVESALLAVGEGLREHRKNIEHIAEVLDEASTHLQRLQNKGWLSSIAWADHDKNNFGRMRDELSSCVGALNLAVTLDLANLQHSQFSQSAKLDALLG